ncbi:MAG: 6-phosphogluconolactonase [Rubricoccaceae bacterium]
MPDVSPEAPIGTIVVLEEATAVRAALASRTADALREALAARGEATLCLTGGSTPGPAYEALARADLDWTRVHLFWGDERAVPPEHAESNFRLAREALLDRLPDAARPAVHRIEGERGAAEAAARYDALLGAHFGGPPAFDVLHLGMGDDGHTASLFPGDAALDQATRWCVPAEAPEGTAIRARVTLTLPALAHARLTLFALTGARKREAFARVRRGDDSLPATRVARQALPVWLVERALAA